MIGVETSVRIHKPECHFYFTVRCREEWLRQMRYAFEDENIPLNLLKGAFSTQKIKIRKLTDYKRDKQADSLVISQTLRDIANAMLQERVLISVETKDKNGEEEYWYKLEGPFYSTTLVTWWGIFVERYRLNNPLADISLFKSMESILGLPCEDYQDMYFEENPDFFKEIYDMCTQTRMSEDYLDQWIYYAGIQSFIDNKSYM